MSTATSPKGVARPRYPKYRRVKFAVDVEVRAGVITEIGRSHDLSASGMFVDSALHYLPGMVVHLRFDLDRRPFATRARIIHVKPHVGFGATFLDLDAKERNHVLRFVHRERATREAERLLRRRRQSTVDS